MGKDETGTLKNTKYYSKDLCNKFFSGAYGPEMNIRNNNNNNNDKKEKNKKKKQKKPR